MPKPITETLLILIVALFPTIGVGLWHPKRPSWDANELRPGEVRVETVLQWPSVLWVDARPAEEYEKQHIPGALPLNEDDWDAQLEPFLLKWQPDVEIVVYCDSRACKSSRSVSARLREEVGLDTVHVLKGGWPAWQRDGKLRD